MDIKRKYSITITVTSALSAEQSLLETLFAKHSTFSHHFEHPDFDLVPKDISCTLLHVINYIPTQMMPSIITDLDERNTRISQQTNVLKAFCAAYTSFYRCGLTMKLAKPICEREHRDSILEKIMAFGPGGDSVFCVFEEAKITAVEIPENLSYPPTGKLDFVAISEGNVTLRWTGS